jgi:threonylcarbamoyladenosine tRNA methylthiotransferase MtaB
VMVGFPGESEAEFVEGYEFIRRVAFDGMHVFKYSPRSGTRATRMPDMVTNEVKAERSRLLRDESLEGLERLRSRHVGVSARVAWESAADGVCRGLTDTNVRVYGEAGPAAVCELAHLRLSHPYLDGLWSESLRAEIPLVAVG